MKFIYAIKISPDTPNINQLRTAHMQCNISDAVTHLCLIIPVFIRQTKQYIVTFRSAGLLETCLLCSTITELTLEMHAGRSVKCPLFWSNFGKQHNMSTLFV